MAFRPRGRTPRDFSRRIEKARRKIKSEKPGASGSYQLIEKHVATAGDVVERTLNSLRHLGSQRFAVAPYYEHFDRWLMSLRSVVSEFQSSTAVDVDEQFAKESAQLLSNIELALKEKQLMEASYEESIRRINQNQLEARTALAQVEREYVTKANEIGGKKERVVKPAVTNIGKLREELNRVVRMRAGFLRGISKKAKAQREAEASQRLDSAKSELAKIEASLATDQQRLQGQYKKGKREILERIANHQREIENLEAASQIDDALDARCGACDALINAVNALLRRTEASLETTSPSS